MKYTLIATNKEGASQVTEGDTMKEALTAFTSVYDTSGFRIVISDNATGRETFLKKTFR